jgi:FkbM family methyltransferase
MVTTLRSLYRTLRFLVLHPVSAGRPWVPLFAFVRWQLGRRLGLIGAPSRATFVNSAQMLVDARHGDSVGVLYTGLPEFWEMGFALHLLREGDLFVDCGANVGTYSVAVAVAAGASCIAIEPVPATYAALLANVALNQLGGRVTCLNVALGSASATLRMTSAHDSGNHVLDDRVEDESGGAIEVPSRTLDEALAGRNPTLIKIDVEGYESAVLDGAAAALASPELLAVILELNGGGQRFGTPDRVVHARMLGLGFETFSYSALTRTLTSLGRQQSRLGNTVYVRHEGRVRERLRTAPAFSIRGKTF